MMQVPGHIEIIAEAIAKAEAAAGPFPARTLVAVGLHALPHEGGPRQFTAGPITAIPVEDAGEHSVEAAASEGARQVNEAGCDVVIMACYQMPASESAAARLVLRQATKATIATVGVGPAGFHEIPGSAHVWPRTLIKAALDGDAIVPAPGTPPPLAPGVRPGVEQARGDVAGEIAAGDGGLLQVQRQALATWRAILAGGQATLSDLDVAHLQAALGSKAGRDAFIVAALPGGSDVADKTLAGRERFADLSPVFDQVLRGTGRLDLARVQSGLDAMADVARNTPPGQAASAYDVAATLAWAAGHPAGARGWLDKAVRDNPADTLAQTLTLVIAHRIGPAPADGPAVQVGRQAPGPRQL